VKCIRDLKIPSDVTGIISTSLQITIGVLLFRNIVRFIPRIIRNPQIHCMDNFFNCLFRAFLDQCIQFIISTKCTVLNTYEHASELSP